MHFPMRKRRWAGLILTLLITIAGIQFGYTETYAFLSWTNACEAQTGSTISAAATILAKSDQTVEEPSWRNLQNVVRPERSRRNTCFRRLLTGAEIVRTYSDTYTRIILPSCRIENMSIRSHSLIMHYIHCQDGAKPDALL